MNLFGDDLQQEIDFSIELLKRNQPQDKPYYGCFSGGKDSCVIKEIARMAGVNVVWHYNVTTIDPPELVRFIKHQHPDVVWETPKENFFQVAEKRMGFPTRLVRWCCEEFKESRNDQSEIMILGVRAAESRFRKASWREINNSKRGTFILPILSWSDRQVWSFLKSKAVPYCSLYDEGFKRLGCIGCPMAGKLRYAQFARWPHMERRWKALFQHIWEKRTGKPQKDGRIWFGDRYFSCWEEMWDWWLNDKPLKKETCQGVLEFYS